MTLHISYRHKCAQCDIDYIPFDTDVPCPKCGLVEAERHDLIRDIVESALFNLDRVGMYTPYAWIVLSFGDRVASQVFRMLQSHHDSDGSLPFETHAANWLGPEPDWGDLAYLPPYILLVAVRVHDELEGQPERVAELWAKADATKEAASKTPT